VLLGYSGNHNGSDHAYRWLTTAVVFVSTSLFFAIVRPYKVNHLNTIDTLFLALLSIQVLIILFVLAKSKVQQCNCSDRVTNNRSSACCICIVHRVHHIKEGKNPSASEKEVPMSIQHTLLAQTLSS